MNDTELCPTCQGYGYDDQGRGYDDPFAEEPPCDNCGGTGIAAGVVGALSEPPALIWKSNGSHRAESARNPM
jgi:hypothetical protein